MKLKWKVVKKKIYQLEKEKEKAWHILHYQLKGLEDYYYREDN